MVDSRVYPGLERKPGGPDNWVERAGGLPDYIERIAKHLHYEKGMTISRAIATAVNTVKRWAHAGKVVKYGSKEHVSAKTVALATSALAEWEAKRVAGRLHLSEAEFALIDMSNIDEEYALLLAEELLDEEGQVIDLSDAAISRADTMIALMIPPDVANKIAVDGGVPPEDMHLTLTFHGETSPEQYAKICADLKAWAADGGPGELKGEVGGLGQFPATDSAKGAPHYVPADVPGINQLHEQVKAVTQKIAPASTDHGFTPHMTLTYGGEAPAPVPPTKVKFSSMHVVRGNKDRTEIPLVPDTHGHVGDGGHKTQHGTIRTSETDLAEGPMDLQALADRANRIEDPALRAAVRRKILDLAVNPTAEQRSKYGMADGSYPVWNAASLKSAIHLCRTPAQRRHVMAAARRLGLSAQIPDDWSVSLAEMAITGLVDLASTIAPLNARGRVSDGRRSYKGQGHWKHGFIPVDGAATASKAKGSPIAEQRINRIFGGKSATNIKAPAGRAGQRSAPAKANPKSVSVTEAGKRGRKSQVVQAESANQLSSLQNTNFDQGNSPAKAGLPTTQKEAGKATRTPARAKQDWNEIPDNLKTIRNGKRYVIAEYAGGQFVTPWVGGVQGVSGNSLDKRVVYANLSTTTAGSMTSPQLRDILSNPRSPANVRTVARKALANLAKEPSRG